MTDSLDTDKLEREVKAVYRAVAERPDEEFHFEMGRSLAVELGYETADLDRIPAAALESFAGVGYHFDLAAIESGEDVLDLGSGSGTDVFVASLSVGDSGTVTGLDMTAEQLTKARTLCEDGPFERVSFEEGTIENLPYEDDRFDVVVSNGVINLSPEKERVFQEISRVLRPEGRLAISDIVSEKEMPESITSDADLWAACIGGAMQVDTYRETIEGVDLTIREFRENTAYEFTSSAARGACEKYGVKSISLLATAPS